MRKKAPAISIPEPPLPLSNGTGNGNGGSGNEIEASGIPMGLAYSQSRNRKHVPCFYRVIETRVEVCENEKCCGNASRRRVFPQLFQVLPNFHECLYNSIETRRTCFLFLLENIATIKRKQLVNFDYQNVNSLCLRNHYVNSAR